MGMRVMRMVCRRIKQLIGLLLALFMVLFLLGPTSFARNPDTAAPGSGGLLRQSVSAIGRTISAGASWLAGCPQAAGRLLEVMAQQLARLTAARIYLTAGTRLSLRPASLAADSPYWWAIWSSNNQQVAAVDQSGQVTALANGMATIAARAEDGRYLRLCTVYVSQPDIALSDGTYLLEAGTSGCFLTADQDEAASGVLVRTFDLFQYQHFRLENIGGNHFRIRSARSVEGLQLTLETGSLAPAAGMDIDLMTDTAGWTRQVWSAVRHWDGSVSILSVADPGLALCFQDGAGHDTPVTLAEYSPASYATQQWNLTPVSPGLAHEIEGCWPLAKDMPLAVWMWPVPSTTQITGSEPVNAFNYSMVHIRQAVCDNTGALVVAAQSGHVVFRGQTADYGMTILIDSDIGGVIYHALYGGLITHYIPAWIRVGSYVHKGDIIGRVGATSPTGEAHLAFGLKSGGTSDTRTGTPLDPLTRIYKWNYLLDQPGLQLTARSSTAFTLHIAPAGSDAAMLYLTASVIACTGNARDANAHIARSIYSRLPVSPGDMELLVRQTGLVPLETGQKYVLLIELEDLSTGRSVCISHDLG